MKNTPPFDGVFFCNRALSACYVYGIRALFAVGDLKGDIVPLAKAIEVGALELICVKEEIFILALALDEPVALIHKTYNRSFIHCPQN